MFSGLHVEGKWIRCVLEVGGGPRTVSNGCEWNLSSRVCFWWALLAALHCSHSFCDTFQSLFLDRRSAMKSSTSLQQWTMTSPTNTISCHWDHWKQQWMSQIILFIFKTLIQRQATPKTTFCSTSPSQLPPPSSHKSNRYYAVPNTRPCSKWHTLPWLDCRTITY